MINLTDLDYWEDADVIHQPDGMDNRKVYRKETFVCLCEEGVNPGDADSIIRGGQSAEEIISRFAG